jgi:hypothetical protein
VRAGERAWDGGGEVYGGRVGAVDESARSSRGRRRGSGAEEQRSWSGILQGRFRKKTDRQVILVGGSTNQDVNQMV